MFRMDFALVCFQASNEREIIQDACIENKSIKLNIKIPDLETQLSDLQEMITEILMLAIKLLHLCLRTIQGKVKQLLIPRGN